jgi:signal transduction histidine kinase
MVQFDNQYRQVKLKIVYYGPGLCGKTTCLQYIHRAADPQRRTKLYALNTASDRTLFFDLLGIDLGRIRGYKLMTQLYTVPGQVQYNATRRAVLAGADGVVFVADSQRSCSRSNEESFLNLIENLKANGLDPATVPLIFQYNKRDLPELLTRQELDVALNTRNVLAFETVATSGFGVIESFGAIAEATVISVADRLGVGSQQEAVKRLVENVRTALTPLMSKAPPPTAEGAVLLRPEGGGEMVAPEELVAEAVRANLAMADLNLRLDRLTGELGRRIANLHTINEFGRLMSAAREPEEVTAAFLDRLLSELRVNCGSLLLLGENGEMVSVLRRGLASEPMLRPDESGRSAAESFLAARQPYVTRVDELEPAQIAGTPWFDEARNLSLVGAMAVPLVVRDAPVGLVTAYTDASRGPFEDEELELASVMAANAAVSLANARAWRSLELLNRGLEEAVSERTRQLQEALKKTESLAAQLEEKNLALESANNQLRQVEKLKGELLNRLAHELNTPVTAIGTAARILSRYNEMPPEKAAKFIDIITLETGRLGTLIAAALQAVVLGVPEGPVETVDVPLADFLKRVLAPMREEINQYALTFQVRVATGLDHITGDPEQLQAAVSAVVKNSIEFNRPGGTVTITVRPVRRGATTMVELRVEDTGIGIPEEQIANVCDVFWQGSTALTGKPRGLGLGLAVAKRVMDNHGGGLEITSKAGTGTVVSMLLQSTQAKPRP